MRPFVSVLVIPLAIGCASAPPAPAPPAVPEVDPFPHPIAWTAVQGAALVTLDRGTHEIPHLFTRVDVVGRDTTGLVVTCRVCDPASTGYIAESDLVVPTALPAAVAAWGELPEFLAAIRDAAQRRDLAALRPVMAADFSYDFIGVQAPEYAFDVWRAEQFRSLDEVPLLLDQGVATQDHWIWSSPPAFVTDLGYRGLRMGFRKRQDGRWEWLYLIRGIAAAR